VHTSKTGAGGVVGSTSVAQHSGSAAARADASTADFGFRPTPVVVVIALVLAVAAGVAAGYGLVRDSKPWLIAAAVVLAPLLVVAAHSAARVESAPRAGALAAVAVLAITFVIVVVLTSSWWDTGERGALPYGLAADTPSARIYLRAKPGGPELTGRRAPTPLVGGHTYSFACSVTLGDHTQWLRVSDSRFWAPAVGLRPQHPGEGELPAC